MEKKYYILFRYFIVILDKHLEHFCFVKYIFFCFVMININETFCFYKMKKTNMMHFLPSRSYTGALHKKLTETHTIISIESFKLLLNKIKRIEKEKLFNYNHNP